MKLKTLLNENAANLAVTKNKAALTGEIKVPECSKIQQELI